MKKPGDKEWRAGRREHSLGREYWLFSVMAGVRGSAPDLNGLDRAYLKRKDFVVGKPRGFPEDISQNLVPAYNYETYERTDKKNLTDLSFYKSTDNSGYHSHSYASADQLEFWLKVYERLHKPPQPGDPNYDPEYDDEEWCMPSSFVKFLRAMRKLEKSGYQVRMIFWFDS